MAKDKAKHDATTVDGILAMADAGAVKIEGESPNRTVSVRALVKTRTNGKPRVRGDVFAMELSVAAAHVKAGQVELAEAVDAGKAGKTAPAGGAEK